MAIHVEWRFRPPKVVPTDLIGMVCDYYERRYTPGTQVHDQWDDITLYCAEAPTFREAIQRAVRSKRRNGKHHNHQSKVFVLPEWEGALTTRYSMGKMANCQTFHELLEFLESQRIHGIGPTTVYDVATRIGEYLELEPRRLYIHAGVRIGAKALGLPKPRFRHERYKDLIWYARMDLPSPLRSMPINDVEDFLCCYRQVLSPALWSYAIG